MLAAAAVSGCADEVIACACQMSWKGSAIISCDLFPGKLI